MNQGMDMEQLRIKKKEVALGYFPESGQAAASRRLRRWIASCPPLVKELRRHHYSAAKHYFTYSQFVVLVKYIGGPEPGTPLERKWTSSCTSNRW